MNNPNVLCNIVRDKDKHQIFITATPSEDFERALKMLVPPKDRWFNPFSFTWEITEDFLDEIISICVKYYGEANVRNNMDHPSATVVTSTETPKDVILSLFKLVGPEKSEQLYKNLSRVFHPDLGGSTALMTTLNNARDDYMLKRK